MMRTYEYVNQDMLSNAARGLETVQSISELEELASKSEGNLSVRVASIEKISGLCSNRQEWERAAAFALRTKQSSTHCDVRQAATGLYAEYLIWLGEQYEFPVDKYEDFDWNTQWRNRLPFPLNMPTR